MKDDIAYFLSTALYLIMIIISFVVSVTGVATQTGLMAIFICFGCSICVGIFVILIRLGKIVHLYKDNNE